MQDLRHLLFVQDICAGPGTFVVCAGDICAGPGTFVQDIALVGDKGASVHSK